MGEPKKITHSGSNVAGEAIGKMLVGKKISNKIDYDKLKDLGFIFGGLPSSSSTPSASTSAGPSSSIAEPVVETDSMASSSKRYFFGPVDPLFRDYG